LKKGLKRAKVNKMKFDFFKKQPKKEESRWEKCKKHDYLDYISIDEIVVALAGFFIFYRFQPYEVSFILGVIVWYWLKIRHFERKIIEKERDVWNVQYNIHEKTEGMPVNQKQAESMIEGNRKPMMYDLDQLKNKRKFLVDIFVVINLILMVLIQLFIKK